MRQDRISSLLPLKTWGSAAGVVALWLASAPHTPFNLPSSDQSELVSWGQAHDWRANRRPFAVGDSKFVLSAGCGPLLNR